MATYASSSNPFIKNNTCVANSGGESPIELAPKRKDAPGMAMHQSQMTNMLKLRDKAGISASSDEFSSPVESRGVARQEEAKIDFNSDDPESLSPTATGEDSKSESDEITKTCESLVETAIRLELEEAASNSSMANTCLAAATAAAAVDSNNDDSHALCESPVHMPVVEEVIDLDADADGELADEEHEDSGHRQHIELIKKLRLQLRDLERYAYERGELGQEVPASVIAERQTVILDTLKERLSLSIDINEIEKLELGELKKQVDKEVHDLIDPLITKDHLLGQLKTQLTDLERYITYLHGTIGMIHDKSACTCHVHGCCTSKLAELSLDENNSMTRGTEANNESRLIDNDTLPRTTRLIRNLVTQLICSDIKLRESAKKAQILEAKSKSDNNPTGKTPGTGASTVVLSKPARANQDDAAWTLHIDKVILATDSLVNLFTTEPEYQRSSIDQSNNSNNSTIDDRLVESIVRRQLVPAIRDLLCYGLIDLNSMPKSNSYISLLFDPYYLLTSLTCFPSSNRAASPIGTNTGSSTSTMDKIHLWNVIEEYHRSRSDPTFKNSSIKTLSQSFDLAPSISGPIKITSKQALLIAIDDINETLSRSKPNGPESHLRAFIYMALNRTKLTTWLRIVFNNKQMVKRFYHNFSFVGQQEKMDKLLATLEPLNQFSFKLRTNVESIEQFVSAF